jgi:hypothetical protein
MLATALALLDKGGFTSHRRHGMVYPRIVSTDLDDLWLLAEWH